MRKLFFTICFTLICFAARSAEARVAEVMDQQSAVSEQNKRVIPNIVPRIDTIQTKEEMEEYIKERLRKVAITKYDPESGSDGASATSVVEDIMDPNAGKTIFEKIYEGAISRIEGEERQRLAPPPLKQDALQQEFVNIEGIMIELPPFGKSVRVPTNEHIPYLFSKIELLKNGLISIEETVVVVSNAQKLKYPLSKVLSQSVNNRKGQSRKVDISLIGVEVNGFPLDYKIVYEGGSVVITPASNTPLDAGVYKYTFKYLVDRQVSYYDDFDEFYWDVTGGTWNLVVTRAGASVVLPTNDEPLGQTLLTGYTYAFTTDNSLITQDGKNVWGFVTKAPLFVAERMPIVMSLPKGMIDEPGFSKKVDWLMIDYGDILFALLGMAAILAGYFASWIHIKKHPKKQTVSLRKTPQMMRYLWKGIFDETSFGAFVLDMYRKNIIDIQESDTTQILIKKTDDLKTLTKNEQKALKLMFNGGDILNVNSQNKPRLKKASEFVEKDLKKQFFMFVAKLNAGYFIFSAAMLAIAEFFIASLKINTAQVFGVMLMVDVFFAVFLILFSIKWGKKWVNITVKSVSVLMILAAYIVLCAFVNMWAALIIFGTCIVIKIFTKKYARRDGLLQANIIEAVNLKKYLHDNKKTISLGKEFLTQQANIFALEESAQYSPSPNTKDYFKLTGVHTGARTGGGEP